ncbi:SseB family protein [Weissella ceti]|uniref:SseB family protein n=1 Tax=Weissella ceti TaxID=759620 RepID=A0ABT3E5E2_9LACO|nr:SseB family protein [Weissella ceti]MCW0953590.1 SseB family protein [Weissella ceti]QVK12190.1 SseB family protein [Weissella ceti]
MAEETRKIDNTALLAALEALREDQNEQTDAAYTKALLEAEFIVPVNYKAVPKQNENGELELPEGSEIALVTLMSSEDGEEVFPIFTDLEAFNAQPEVEGKQTVHPWGMMISDYFPMLLNGQNPQIAGLALNPFSDGMPISRENIEYLAAMSEALQGGEGGQVEVKSANDMLSNEFRYELIGFGDDHPEAINKMTLLWLEADGDGQYLLVVDGDDEAAVSMLYPELEAVFEEFAGEEGPFFSLMMEKNFDADLSEFPELYTRNA